MYYTIYKTTNLINNKFYIGMHKTKNIDDGYLGSGKYILNSINKYGKENFKKEILFILNSEDEMILKEKEILTEEFLKENEDKIYNINIGGDGSFTFINKNYPRKGVETRAQLIKQNKEYRYNYYSSISKSMKNFYKNNPEKAIINYSWKDKKHKQETIEKMKLSHKNKHNGSNNSQYGTCWIYKDNINKKIKKEDLDLWLQQGWFKGRNI